MIFSKSTRFAAEIVNKAEAYKQTRIAESQGETSRFLALLTEYEKAKDITKKRLLFESLEKMLNSPSMEKMVLPNNGTNQIMPLIPMGNTTKNITPNIIQELQQEQNLSSVPSSQTPVREFTRGIR